MNSLLVFGRKSQFLLLQSKVKGHAELLGSGKEGRMREAMADRCLQRPDCTSVTIRRKKGFTTTTKNPSPLHLHCTGHVVNAPLFLFGKNTGLPCQPLWPLPYPDGLGVSHQGPRPSGSCVGPLYRPSHRFLPASVWTGSLTAPLSQPRDSSALRVRAGCSRVTGNPAQIVSKLLF